MNVHLFFTSGRERFRDRASGRRGVILLVIMSVLALFSVIGLTFVLMAGRARENAEAVSRFSPEAVSGGTSPQELLEEGIMQVLVGPGKNTNDIQSTNSALYRNDLLGDMYGYNPVNSGNDNKPVASTITAASTNANGLPQFTVGAGNANYVGRFFTITSGKLKGNSSLIIKSEGNSVVTMPFEKAPDFTKITSGDTCLINARPFQNEYDYDIMDPTSLRNKHMSLRFPGGDVSGYVQDNKTGRVIVPSYYRPGAAGNTNGNYRPGLNAATWINNTNYYPTLSTATYLQSVTNMTSPWDIDNDGDGDEDSVWMSLGLPPRPMADGTMVVPMYAILVEDLDGRLNVNAHGQYNHSLNQTNYTLVGSTATTGVTLVGGAAVTAATSANSIAGQGYGPADVNLWPLTCSTGAGNATLLTNLFRERYRGSTSARGSATNSAMQYKFPDMLYTGITDPTQFMFSVTNQAPRYRTPLDLFGNMIAAVDNRGMFIWLRPGTTTQNMLENPYELNLGYGKPRSDRVQSMHNLYTPEELEMVLRVYDDDAPQLSRRLVNNLNFTDSASFKYKRNLVTTESWDLPVCKWLGNNTYYRFLSDDLQAGFKMDINRPLTSYEVNATVADTERTQLAQDFYYLLKMVQPGLPARQAAQWAVNAVDFRDSDSVCTRLAIDGVTVFGCERPEVLISETFAFHARMTEDSPLGGWHDNNSTYTDAPTVDRTYMCTEAYDAKFATNYETFVAKYSQFRNQNIYPREKVEALADEVRTQGGDGIVDMDQVYRPETGLYVELYNPWVTAGQTEAVPADLYNSSTAAADRGVDLGSSKGGSPVWRLAIADSSNQTTTTTSGTLTKKFARDFRELTNTTPERVVYFGTGAPQNGSVATYTAGTGIRILKPGRTAVVGPSENTIISREDVKSTTDSVAPISRQISLNATSINFSGQTRQVLGIPVPQSNNGLRLSLTEENTYKYPAATADGRLTVIQDKPCDASNQNRWQNLSWGGVARGRGLGDDFVGQGYRVVYLQRLANPHVAYNATSNPYITVDQMPVDLNSFNGRCNRFADDNYNKTTITTANRRTLTKTNKYIKARQRGEGNYILSRTRNLWLGEECPAPSYTPNATAHTRMRINSFNSTGGGAMNEQIPCSFGSLNTTVFPLGTTGGAADVCAPNATYVPAYYFPNRPFNSIMELLLVPQVSGYELTSSAFAIDNTTMAGLTTLPAFIQPPASGNYGTKMNLVNGDARELFSYVRIQSPFSDTPMVLNAFPNISGGTANNTTAATAKYRWSFREPGKINLNTIYHPAVWAAILNRPQLKTEFAMKTTYTGTENYMTLPGLQNNVYKDIVSKDFRNLTTQISPFSNYGTAGAAKNFLMDNYINFQVGTGAATGVQQFNDPKKYPYFQIPLLQRLSNVTTTRSNVYAVWVTVGFFEYMGKDAGGTNITQYKVSKEYGLDTGSQQRYRAFYLIDRTRPAGYEPGQRHNADDTIILRRYLP